MPLFPQPFAHPHGGPHALDGVVGIDQKNAVVGHRLGIGVEGFLLRLKRHHPAVGMGALDRDAVAHAGEDIRSGGASANVSGPGGRHGAVDALSAAQAEFENRFRRGGVANSCRLGRDQGLEIDDIEQRRFQDLALDDGAGHPYQRFVGENQRAFGDGVDIAGEAQVAEIIDEAEIEEGLSIVAGQGGQVGQFVFVEVKILEIIDDIGQSAGNAETAVEGILPEEEMEDRLAFVDLVFPIAVGHCQLVKVGEENRVFLLFRLHLSVKMTLRAFGSKDISSDLAVVARTTCCPGGQKPQEAGGSTFA